MKTRMRQWLTAGSLILLTMGTVCAEQTLTLHGPLELQVFQRNQRNQAKVTVSGVLHGAADVIEVQARLNQARTRGRSLDWTAIATGHPIDHGRFTGQVVLDAGGWYTLTVRARRGKDVVSQCRVEKVGVGDVFITAGQSNSANYGQPRQTARDDRVVYYDGQRFVPARDPIPGGCGSKGSVWPILGDLIVRSQQVPVCFRSASLTWTEVKNWLPGVKYRKWSLYDNLVRCVREFGKGGVRAVLWHQGESDSLAKTSAQTYYTRLKTVIESLNKDAGQDIPWYVAQASFHPGSKPPQEHQVAKGQQLLWEKGVARKGPITDDLLGKTYRCDGVHFNQLGLTTHAQRWFKALYAQPGATASARSATTSNSTADDLDGLTGRIIKLDLNNRRFEFLTQTMVDPQTGAEQSRFPVYWTDKTTITEIEETRSFAGLKGPVVTDFHGIDSANAKALQQAKPFIARIAVVLADAKTASGVTDNHRQIVGWFTPAEGEAPTSGTVQVRGQPVQVSMRRRSAHIYVHRIISPADLSKGMWEATIHGRRADGRFVVQNMEVHPQVDPRTVDDPTLPRVLVVGDSISMLYHDAAKAALKGVANYYRIEGNSFSTAYGVKNMARWLGDYRQKGLHWDVIQFNHGLHDLKQTYDKAHDTWGAYAVCLDDYKRNLEKEIQILKKTGAKLIWCTTTPVPNSNKGKYARRKGAAAIFNQAAMEVIRKHPEIQVNDLYRFICDSKAFDEWRKGNEVHFWSKDLQALIGKEVAAKIKKVLDQ